MRNQGGQSESYSEARDSGLPDAGPLSLSQPCRSLYHKLFPVHTVKERCQPATKPKMWPTGEDGIQEDKAIVSLVKA